MINWNNYQSNVISPTQNHYRDILPDPSFQGANNFFVFSFENN